MLPYPVKNTHCLFTVQKRLRHGANISEFGRNGLHPTARSDHHRPDQFQ